jgi:hypothetical protein
LAALPKGTLLTAGNLTIKETEINRAISKAEPEAKKQLAKNGFYLLDNLAPPSCCSRKPIKLGIRRKKMSKRSS